MAKANFFSLLRDSYHDATTPAYIDGLFVSWLLPTWVFFGLRALVATYMFTVQFFILGWYSTHGKEFDARVDFGYFTVLTYWGLAFYYAFAAAHTASYAATGKAWLRAWPGWLQYMHSVLYTTVTVYPWVVTAVFWAVLATGAFKTTFTTWSNISQHALNSVLCFLEISLPMSSPHPWINMVPLVVILACYLGLAYLVHTVDHFYVYDFLNPKNGRGLVAGACIGILAAALVVFVIVRYLIWLRKWITERKMGRSYRLPQSGNVDENQPDHEIESGQVIADPEKHGNGAFKAG